MTQREGETIEQGKALAGTSRNQQFEISKALNANDAAQHRARVISCALSIVSTLLLVVAKVGT